jgi:hypothetical protein
MCVTIAESAIMAIMATSLPKAPSDRGEKAKAKGQRVNDQGDRAGRRSRGALTFGSRPFSAQRPRPAKLGKKS